MFRLCAKPSELVQTAGRQDISKATLLAGHQTEVFRKDMENKQTRLKQSKDELEELKVKVDKMLETYKAHTGPRHSSHLCPLKREQDLSVSRRARHGSEER